MLLVILASFCITATQNILRLDQNICLLILLCLFPLFLLQKFKVPHDIVVTADGSVFVGDAASDSVIKFVQSESKLTINIINV